MSKSQKGFIYICLLSTLVSEMLLSPFYPQLFSEYFQVEGVQATSLFISCCRIVVIVMTPIWTIFMKRWGLQRLIPIALLAMAGCKLLFPTVGSFSQFLTLSILLLFFQSSIYLLYPALVASSKNEDEKVKGTTAYLVIFHGSVIVSGLLGSFAINQPLPLNSYYIFALFDLFLAVGSYFSLSNNATKVRFDEKKKVSSNGVNWQGEFILYLLIVFLFFLGHNAIRPFFTTFLENTYRMTKQDVSLLYVMPSLVAIMLQFLLPKNYLKSHVKAILLVLTGISGGMVILHAVVNHFWVFVFIRMVYSICFFVSLVGIDILFFQLGVGKKSPLSYSLVISMQNIALLFAPMSALTMVETSGFKGPFFLSGILLISSAICVILLSLSIFKPSIYLLKKGVGQRENM